MAGHRRPGEERPRPPEDRQDRRGVFSEARGALDARPDAGARRADAPVRDLARARVRPGRGLHPGQRRIEKLLEDALIKISSVLTDMLGVSGRAMIEALIAGQRSPKPSPSWPRAAPGATGPPSNTPCTAGSPTSTPGSAGCCWANSTSCPRASTTSPPCSTPRSAPYPLRRRPPAPTRPATTPPSRPPPATSAPPRGCARSPAAWTPRAVLGEISLDMSVFGTPQRLRSWTKVRAPHRSGPGARPAGPAPARASPTSWPRSHRSPPVPRRPTPSSANATVG